MAEKAETCGGGAESKSGGDLRSTMDAYVLPEQGAPGRGVDQR